MIDQLRMIAELWNWLPAFRAVAEAQHLPTAATRLLVTPPAMSRSLKLLEERVGKRLFDRRGRRLVINADGERLAAAVRSGMRLLDEALRAISATTYSGRVLIACTWSGNPILFEALDEILRRHPQVEPWLMAVPPGDGARPLSEGKLDVLIVAKPLRDKEVLCEHLCEQGGSVYCGEGHPLAGVSAVEPEELGRHSFVAPPPDDYGQIHDGWPPQLPRAVGMHISRMSVGLEVCVRGKYLAVLPDMVVDAYPGRAHLRRLPLSVVPPVSLFVIRRRPLPVITLSDVVAEAVKECAFHHGLGNDAFHTSRQRDACSEARRI